MEDTSKKIAMFIDVDNAPAKTIEFILAELAKHGTLSIRRAYGNWKSPTSKLWEANLHEHAIQPIQQFDLTKGKNATDMAMTIDAMDILYTKNIDIFCIVSSDCDFTPLVMRILSEGKLVYGFGERKALPPFVNACSKFLYLEELKEEKEVLGNFSPLQKMDGNVLKQDKKLIKLIKNAIISEHDDEGWASLAKVGSIISNQASIDPRNYGYTKLSNVIKAIDSFEIKEIKSGKSMIKIAKN